MEYKIQMATIENIEEILNIYHSLIGKDGCIKEPCDLARIAVKTKYQNKGIAKYLISYIEKQVIKRGFDGIHFLVSKTNPHAKAVYDKMNYICCGECKMYDKDWYCYEKKLI